MRLKKRDTKNNTKNHQIKAKQSRRGLLVALKIGFEKRFLAPVHATTPVDACVAVLGMISLCLWCILLWSLYLKFFGLKNEWHSFFAIFCGCIFSRSIFFHPWFNPVRTSSIWELLLVGVQRRLATFSYV